MTHPLLEDEEASRIAAELAAKYGLDAIEHIRMRADQARSVGDELAHGAWQAVRSALENRFAFAAAPSE